MFEKVKDVKAALRAAVAELDPDLLEGSAAAALVEDFSEVERLAAAGKALAARRVASSGAWRHNGDRSPAHWLARASGTSVGNAAGMLETSERIRELPATEAASRAGKLSEAQVTEIASAAAAHPASENELLAAAQTESVAGLRQRCAQVRAAATPDAVTRYEAIRRRRRLRHWTDAEGAFRLDALLTPDAGAVVLAALEPHRERIFTEARKQNRREPYEAYAADALVTIAAHARDCDRDPVATGPTAMVHIRVDHRAFTAGEAAAGEVCDIPGVGPIPVATARALSQDAIVAALITDGTDVRTVSHLGRVIPARLRTAVVARDQTCVVPGCDVRHQLQIDHVIPVSARGATRLDNLARLCPWHHYLKTHHRYRLAGGPGSWRWEAPERRSPTTRAETRGRRHTTIRSGARVAARSRGP